MTVSSEQALARRLADFERRLKAMERGDRLTRSSIVVDDTGRSLTVTAAVVTGSREASLLAARALSQLLAPSVTPWSVWFTDTEPTTAAYGDLWLRNTLEPTLARLNAVTGEWVDLADQTGAPAVAGLRSSLATEDGRVVAWITEAQPADVPAFGDLWLPSEAVAYRWEASAGWQPLVVAEGQSLNYKPGENGWAITPDGDSQFKDVSALGNVSGSTASYDQLSIGGVDYAESLASFPRGKVLEAFKASGTECGPIVAVESRLFLIQPGDRVKAGRGYSLKVHGHLQREGTLSAVDTIDFKLRYTLDGSDPTVASPVVSGGSGHGVWRFAQDGTSAANNRDFILEIPFDSPITDPDTQTLKLILTGIRVGGSCSFVIYQAVAGRGVMFEMYDTGPAGTRDNGTVQQLLGLTESPPIGPFTKTFNALWAYGVDTNGTLVDSYFCIGNSPYGSTGAYGLVGWDSAAIIAALANSVTPTNVVLRWRPKYRATSTGLDVRIMSHNYASRAAAAAAGFPEDYTADTSLALLTTRANAVANTPYDQALGVSVFNQFKAGTRKGVAFSNNGSPYSSHPDGTGQIYGNGTYECQLIFTYQGTS